MLRILTIVSAFLCAYEIGASEQTFHPGNIDPEVNYPVEGHYVTTKDGYILKMHRMSRDKAPKPPGASPVVFLMHGILGASNSFTYMGMEHSIAYHLADCGYDVWMGNARGNRYSRSHVTLDPDRHGARFFDFTFEDIALEDLPAMFDYVLAKTKQEKFHYIGHSQGGTVFLVLNSMTDKYHKKIASAHLLAGVGYQNNFPNTQLRLLATTTDTLYNSLRIAGNVELFPPGANSIFRRFGSITGALENILNIDASSDLIAGAALKQIALYGQNIRDRAFRRWNYGRVQNLVKYGSINPPRYALSNIDLDVTFVYSLNDTLLSESDTLAMARSIPNAKVHKVARASFTHFDYILSEDAKELVTDYIINALKNT